jgi:hypothetical protein
MAVQLKWKLEGGFARFLQESSLEVVARLPGRAISGKLTPWSLLSGGKKPVMVSLDTARSWSGPLPGGMRWTTRPSGDVEVRILPPGASYLGNFKVPDGACGIQWTVVGTVQAGGGGRAGPGLLDFRASSRIRFAWVQVFQDENLEKAVALTWQSFVNPFDAGSVARMKEETVLQFSWSGSWRVSLDVKWRPVVGWSLGAADPLIEVTGFGDAAGWAQAGVKAERRGAFSLRASRRRGDLRLTLGRDRGEEQEVGFQLGVELKGGVDLKTSDPWLRTPLNKLEQNLAGALRHRVGARLGLAAERWSSKRDLLKLESSGKGYEDAFAAVYGEFLEGKLPATRKGVRMETVFESVRGRRFTLELHLLNWLGLARTSRREERFNLSVGPDGQVVVERGIELEEVRRRWEEVQFLRLLWSDRGETEGGTWRWSFGESGRMERAELERFLRAALHTGALESFSLPGTSQFPARLEFLWVTEFEPSAISGVFTAGPDHHWWSLVRALEIAEPARYGRPGFWRDWIESEELRRAIDRDPVTTALAHRYLIPGRSEFERTQVVSDYRRARTFLQTLEGLGGEAPEQQIEFFRKGLRLPIFLFFHLVTSSSERRSGLLVHGDLELAWGDTRLLG